MELKPNQGARKTRRRVGRGISSGLGKTCGRGHKGQRSRSGKRQPFTGFEGGQTPLYRRIPKRGFRSRRVDAPHGINLSKLDVFSDGETVTVDSLREHGLLPKSASQVKILGSGEIKAKLTLQVHAVSAGAKAKLDASGSTVMLLEEAPTDAE